MSNDLPIVVNPETLTNSTSTLIAQVGNKNTQVAHADKVVANTNIYMLNNSRNSIEGQNAIIDLLNVYLSSRSKEYYNLFVINGETFGNGRFLVPSDRALTESIEPTLKSELAALSEVARARIKTFPSLFMSELESANREQIAYYGFITDIIVQSNGIRIEFQMLSQLPQHSLNVIYRELALAGRPNINELHRTHWTIKKVDLLDELRIAGIDVFGGGNP